jgi:TonB family protein
MKPNKVAGACAIAFVLLAAGCGKPGEDTSGQQKTISAPQPGSDFTKSLQEEFRAAEMEAFGNAFVATQDAFAGGANSLSPAETPANAAFLYRLGLVRPSQASLNRRLTPTAKLKAVAAHLRNGGGIYDYTINLLPNGDCGSDGSLTVMICPYTTTVTAVPTKIGATLSPVAIKHDPVDVVLSYDARTKLWSVKEPVPFVGALAMTELILSSWRGDEAAWARAEAAVSLTEAEEPYDDPYYSPPRSPANSLSGAVGQGAGSNRPVGPPGIIKPDWIRKPSGEAVNRAYPERALREGVSGRVSLRCTVNADGTVSGCQPVSENPVDYGFGDAAIRLSKQFKMKPQTIDGMPVDGAVVVIPLAFSAPGEY